MKYRSPQNRRRAARGVELIESHPDFTPREDDWTDGRGIDAFTAATDTIADILHALNAAGVYDDPASALGPEDVLSYALWGYQGDFEDEPPADERPPGPWDDFPARKREEPRVFGQGPA